MALYIEKTLDNGVQINYFRIGKIELDMDNLTVKIEMLGYVNEELRRDLCLPVFIKHIQLSMGQFLATPINITNFSDITGLVYNAVKYTEDFIGSIDI